LTWRLEPLEVYKLKGRTLKKRTELAAGRLAMAALWRLSRRLTPRRIERWGARLGDFMFVASRRYRRVVLENLAAAFPDWSKQEVRRTGRNTFRNFARGALEFFYLLHLPPDELDRWIKIEGTEHLDAALKQGRGAIIVTAHLGNWELFARKLVLLGYRLNVIARDSDDPGMTGIANAIRQKGGYQVLARDASALPAMRCLRRNEVLGILPDQNAVVGIFVDFFGRPAATATGPAVFSLRSGAPIICGFAPRTEEGRFKAVMYPPLVTPTSGDEEADVRALTATLTKVIEEQIRKDPAQWLWLHDRWRRWREAQ
jgi:KDO2-lipid IV(A) lauroyltransferase